MQRALPGRLPRAARPAPTPARRAERADDGAGAHRLRRRRGARGAAAVPARAAAADRRAATGRRRSSRARGAVAARRRCAPRVRERVRFVDPDERAEDALLARGRRRRRRLATARRPRPALLRARARRRRGAASRRALPVYEEVLGDGERGLLFEPGDVDDAGRAARAADRRRRRCASALRDAARAAARAARLGARRRRARGASTRELAARRHDAERRPGACARGCAERAADRRRPAHAHRPLAATARRRSRCCWPPRATQGLGAIAVTDHNEISGALDARAKAGRVRRQGDRRPRRSRPRDQGEVIGLFLEEKIPRGMTLQETDRRDQAPGRPRLRARTRSTACTRCPTTSTCSTSRRRRRDRGLQPARRDRRVQRGGRALRGQVPDRRRRRLGLARRRRASARCASACATSTGPRSSSSRCATPTSSRKPSSPALRAGAEVPRDEGHARRRPRGAAARAPRAAGDAQGADARARRSAREPSNPSARCPPPTTRSARSTSSARSASSTRSPASCRPATHCPRGNLMPVLGSGHPQADVFLLKYAPTPSEIEEGVAFYGRAGTALMKSLKRLGIDPLAVYGTLCVKCPVADTVAGRRPRASRGWSRRSRSSSREIVVVMGADALAALNDLDAAARPARSSPARRGPDAHAVDRRARTCRTSTTRSTRRPPSARSGPPSGCSATGGRTSRRTEVASPPRGGRLLSVKDVVVRFGGVVALDGLSFEVASGEICGLIGPNGAGKTTLFNCVSRLYDARRGARSTFDGRGPARAAAPHEIARARHRPHVPEPRPVPVADRARERDGRRAPPRRRSASSPRRSRLPGVAPRGARAARDGRRDRSTGSSSPTSPTARPSGCRTARSSASSSPARWRAPEAAAARRAGQRAHPRRGRRARPTCCARSATSST